MEDGKENLVLVNAFYSNSTILQGLIDFLSFHDLPYVLIVNRDDATIDFEYTTRRFRDSAARLLIVETAIDHYPQEISKEYFQERIGRHEIDRIAAFLRNHRRT